MSKLDFNSIYKEHKFDYIHSHVRNFNKALDLEGQDFGQILKEIKQRAFETIRRDIKNFRSIEDSIAKSQIQKFKQSGVPVPKEFTSPDKDGFKNYMTFLKEYLGKTGVTPASSIVQFKSNTSNTREMGKSVLKAREKIIEKMFGKGKEFKNLNTKEKNLIKEAEKKVKKEEKKFLDHTDHLTNRLAAYIESIIIFSLRLYDPHRNMIIIEDNTMNKSAKELLSTFKALNINLKNVSIENIKKSITNLGAEKFLSTFLAESEAKDFLGGLVDGVNANSNLGNLYELALVETLKELVREQSKEKIIAVFNEGDIKTLGTAEIKKFSTIDIQFIKQDTEHGNISFGATLKLKDKPDIDTTTEESRWQRQFRNTIGTKDFKKFSYFRKNILALNSFKEDKEEIKASLIELIDFEEDIIEIVGLLRLLVGLYEVIGNQYKSSGSQEEEFYYIAYIFTSNNVFSTADVLEAFLGQFGGKTFETQGFSVKGYQLKDNNLSKDQFEKLWDKKQKAIQSFRKNNKSISYQNIMSDKDVLESLLNLNKVLGDFSYSGGLKIHTTEPAIIKALRKIGRL